VEDNPDDVPLTLRALKQYNVLNQVVVAKDGVETLDCLFGTGVHQGRNQDDQPAAVLLDLKLPKVDGLEVVRPIRADPRTRLRPVNILTPSKEESGLINGCDLSANAYGHKPVDFSQSAEAVRELGMFRLVLNDAPPERRPR
jgi:CheY-like chemotaxis protein